MSDLDAFPPTPQALDIASVAVQITPIRVGEIPKLLAAIRPFGHRLVGGDPDWFALLAEHGDALITAVAVASRQPEEWVEELAMDDAIRLAAALFEVNADFFVQRVVPTLQHTAARINAQLGTPLAGLTPSTA
ncbi:hypothetical protein AGMMS50225_06670 [Betaproteobacteria bacterium]|nr:hypothetical protein AGMMS50225_06670 [Betaproteobacteria bacterium]